MEPSNKSESMIHMFAYPVFCVKDGIIVEANRYAQTQTICVGTPIAELLNENLDAYQNFHGCCISLTLSISGVSVLAVAVRFNEMDVFHLYGEAANEQFRAMALVAKELCNPLTELLNIMRLGRQNKDGLTLKKNLYALQRITSNISAANAYSHGRPYGMQVLNLSATLNTILTESQRPVTIAKRQLTYTCPEEPIYCPIDSEILKKAIFNLISNAIKGSPENSTISVDIHQVGDKVHFTIENTDNGLGDGLDLFARHMRPLQIEDGRHGIGLGIPIAQFAASIHDGVLLMERPKEDVIRFTLTISTRTRDGDILCSPVMQIDSFCGLRRSYVEFADILPSNAFKNI